MDSDLQFTLESYGCSTPVFVREALDAALDSIDSSNVTFNFDSKSGWSWIVTSRTVYVWNFKVSKASCFTLPLSQSGLKHHADLFTVFFTDGRLSSSPCCISVSPEGIVRLWLKPDCSSAYSESTIELGGQVGQCLRKLPHRGGFLLTTSTCSLFLIIPSSDWSKPLTFTSLKVAQSVVAGFSRRVSSLLFSSANVIQENKLISCCTAVEKSKENSCLAFILTSKFIQCWQIVGSSDYRTLWECDVAKLALDIAMREVWNLKSVQAMSQFRSSVDLSLLHCCVYDNQLFILISFYNRTVSSELYYAVGCFSITENMPTSFTNFLILKDINEQVPLLEDVIFPYDKILHMHGHSNMFLVGDRQLLSYDSNGQCYKFALVDDKFIGSGSYATHVLVFSMKDGLQCVKHGEKTVYSVFSEEASIRDQLTYSEDMLELLASGDRYKLFKAAFLAYLEQNLTDSEKTLADLFSDPKSSPGKSINDLNDVVLRMSTDIVDDYPASDARWSSSIPSNGSFGFGGRTSLFLLYQLEDKRKTLNLFVEFLKRMSLWKALTAVPCSDKKLIDCHNIIWEHLEKVEACISFFDKDWSRSQSVIKKSMRTVLKDRNETCPNELTVEDMFFRKVSECDQIIPTLINDLCLTVSSLDDITERVNVILDVSEFITTFLQAAQKLRSRNLEFSLISSDYIWTSAESIKNALIKLHSLCADYTNESGDARRIALMAEHLSDLTDCLLIDARDQLLKYWSTREAKLFDEKRRDFENFRTKLLDPFLCVKQYERAAVLSEKFNAFDILIRLCDICGDDSLLEAYKRKFSGQDFDQVLNQWYLQEGKYDKLLHQRDEKLKSFLTDYHDDLKWIFYLNENDYRKCAESLVELSQIEISMLSRKKTLLSLAKLSALCQSPEENDILTVADKGLNLVSYQEKAPLSAIEHYGFDNTDTMPPLSAQDLIELYITDPEANEWSFAKCLDLLGSYLYQAIPQEDFDILKTRIWSSTILRDDWKEVIFSDEPLKASKSTIFAKTLTLYLSICKDFDLKDLKILLPSTSLLLASVELENLAENPVFQYVLNAGEEELNLALRKRFTEDHEQETDSMLIS